MIDLEGNIDVPNPSSRSPGYRYFGIAKKLLDVCKLFNKPLEQGERRICYDIYKRIDASYYRYCDDEDGVLECLEGPVEEKMWCEAVEEWQRLEEVKKEARKGVKSKEVAMVSAATREILHEEEEEN